MKIERNSEKQQKISPVLTHILVFLLGIVLSAAIGTLTFLARGENKFEALERIISTHFVEDADLEAAKDAGARAMVSALGDQWSSYFSKERYLQILQDRENEYVGIGITIRGQEDGTGVNLVKIQKDGPADRAGLKIDDEILKVDGRNTELLDQQQIRALVVGEVGTNVTLTIRRGSEILDLMVTRGTVAIPVATGKMLADSIGYVTISNFHERCYEETVIAVNGLLEQGAKALVFDLRNNPGGRTTDLVQVLDYLLPEGPVFRTEGADGNVKVEESGASCVEVPMAVLINGSSYSAAEFFAAALQEYEAAVIVGEKTSGKGYYQTVFELPDGSAVSLSIGRYFTPNGHSLIDVGVTPDVEVKVDEETAAKIRYQTLEPEKDPQVLAAIDALKTGN